MPTNLWIILSFTPAMFEESYKSYKMLNLIRRDAIGQFKRILFTGFFVAISLNGFS